MTTAIDTNILIAVWSKDQALNSLARSALDRAMSRGPLVISPPVYAELLALPSRSEAFLDSFCRETGVTVDWLIEESVWRAAARAFGAYAARRKKQSGPGPRRILADFIIGAHALRNGYNLLTMDDRFFHTAFPELKVIAA